MTLYSDQRKIIYQGDGTTTTFTIPFYFINNADIQVSVSNGQTVTDLVLNTDYTLSGAENENGGTVTTTVPVASGSEIAILRQVDYKQEMDIPENDRFPSKNMERALDRLTMQTQQLAEQVGRSVTVDIFSNTDPSELVNEIEVLYGVKDEVITAAENIGSIVIAANDINAIKDAPNQATAAAQSATAAEQAENNTLSYKDEASTAAQQAGNSANQAQSWAIGDISTRPEGSAKYWAETAEQKAVLNTIRTNCITSAPQPIKLELNNGTLTLKAGSKVYDGNGLFKSIDADVSVNTTGFYFPCCLFIQENGTFGAAVTSEMRSGDTLPSSGNVLFYNTTDKKCYRIINGSVSAQTSFPICILQSAASIDRVFNELGYIGNTMFSLQSLKGLIPNGRNADGSLNNIEFETAGVLTHTVTSGYDGYIVLNGTILSGWNVNNSRYDFENNINLYNGVKNNVSIVGTVSTNSTGRITSFNPKLPFQAVDRSDGEWAAHNAMPSDQYIDLTVGANGTMYTAPADGYFFASGNWASSGSLFQVTMDVENYGVQASTGSSGPSFFRVLCPVLKGEVMTMIYTLATITVFRFIYAEGAK